MTDTAFKTAFRKLHRDAEASLDNGNDPGELLLQAFCSTCASNPRNLGATGFTLARRYGERILTDRTTTTGTVPRLGEVVTAAVLGAGDQRYYGFSEIPASSPDPTPLGSAVFQRRHQPARHRPNSRQAVPRGPRSLV